MSESRLEYALAYASLGWLVHPVFSIGDDGNCRCGRPCKKPGKHPMTEWMKEASNDPAKITLWFQKWPHANIGIVTGEVSGIFALDIDLKTGGEDSLDAIESKHGRVPDDVLAVTGSGGKHFIFKYPGKLGGSTTNLWPGIDTRGDGGYIVVAPSNHVSGGVYFWDAEADPLAGAEPAYTPEWLLQKLRDKNQPVRQSQAATTAKSLPRDEVKRVRVALGYIPADDRDTWRNVGMALHATGAGDQAFGLWCEWSQQSDKFDLKDQRRVWESFKPGGGITLATLFSMAKTNGWIAPVSARQAEPCLADTGATATEQETTPANTNRKQRDKQAETNSDAVLGLLHRYVFLKNHNRIYDTITRNELSREGFDGSYLHVFGKGKPSEIFLTDPEAVKVDGLIYLPGEKKNPVNRDGAVLWNIWRNPCVILPAEATREDVEPWLKHLHYLYPNLSEQSHILNWMAWTLQRPQTKINHGLLLAGTSRVGKDMLLNPLRFGLGSANVREPSAGELKESFTDYLHHTKLVIFQEIQSFEGLNLENKLKVMLAAPPDVLRLRLFGVGFYETPNIVQAVFMSNYRDALHISEGDGRYFTVWTDATPLEPDYYSNLAQWLEGGGNGLVVRWLLGRDLSAFNPKQPAPLTQFKTAMMGTSQSPLKHLLHDMIEAQDFPFNVDCVRSLDVAKALRDKFSAKSIGSVLSEIGSIQLMCKRATGKREKVSLFAVRNLDDWRQSSAIKWLDEYDARRE